MSSKSSPVRPEVPDRGLACLHPEELGALVAGAFDAVAALVPGRDLDAPAPTGSGTVRDLLVELGSWPEHARFESLIADARAGRLHDLVDVRARTALLTAAHHDADAGEVVAALHRARDTATAFLAGPEAETVGLRLTASPAGELPLNGTFTAACFELATHALDLAPAEELPVALLDPAVAALVDVTGALVWQHALTTRLAVVTPAGRWATSVTERGWLTWRLSDAELARERWPGVEGQAADVLLAAEGRGAVLSMVLSRRLRLKEVASLTRLLPALEDVPGMPSGSALSALSRTAGRAGSALGALARSFG